MLDQKTESRFLCHLLGNFVKGRSCGDKPLDLKWNDFEMMVARNGLTSIVQHCLGNRQIPLSRLPTWRGVSLNVILRHERAVVATARLFQVLEAEKIVAVALRGMALTHCVYSDPILRPMVDVDILVPAQTRNTFVQRLAGHGISPRKILRSQFVYHIDGTKFEVHWSFLTPKRYRNQADFSSWLDSRRKQQTKAGAIYCLSPENELLELICHAFIHHELDTLLKLVDIALVAQTKNLDWEYLAHWCHKAAMSRMFHVTLALADELFELDLLGHFSPSTQNTSARTKRTIEAYSARLFGRDSLSNFVWRKRNLLHVAEPIGLKAKQLLRFASKDQLGGLIKSLQKNTQGVMTLLQE